MMSGKFNYKRAFLFFAFFVLGWVAAQSQTTEFTYQGRFNDGGQAATGSYDFEFRLFDAETNGNQIAAQQRPGVQVTGGIFSVKLDFGANFDGQARFLEIAVKPAGSANSFVTLAPRQSFTSTPYAIRSLNAANAAQLGGVDSGQFVLTTDPRMTNDRNPLPNSANYIQNSTARQTNSNFNVSGNGSLGGTLSANTVDSTTQYNIRGLPILVQTNTGGLMVGVGTSNAGNFNTLLGTSSGSRNTGDFNTFVGQTSGNSNTTGSKNSFFGHESGLNNTIGENNSFFGRSAGTNNTTGGNNTFLGLQAGFGNTTGGNNTVIGSNANVGSNNLNFATAIGAGSLVFTSNTVALGRSQDSVLIQGILTVQGSALGGNVAVCRNTAGQISSCSSSLRYKTNIASFNSGLNLVSRLRPITFTWKDGGMKDFGLGAEDVAEVEPLLVTYNSKGEVEGVKYDRVAVVLLNAVKEQQVQIEKQNAQIAAQEKQIREQNDQIKQQQAALESLKQIVCQSNAAAKICQ
jgi:Chaperone of endosialidase